MTDQERLSTSDIADQANAKQDRNGDTKPGSTPEPKPIDKPGTADDPDDDRAIHNPTVTPERPARPPDTIEHEKMQTQSVQKTAMENGSASSDDGRSDDGQAALLDGDEAEDLRQRWSDIQTGFVDRPKDAVSQADELVAQTIKRLAEGFADERDNLEGVWSRGGDVSTEDLRVALQRYRSFFERLLNA